jgi:hypothetical protein
VRVSDARPARCKAINNIPTAIPTDSVT